MGSVESNARLPSAIGPNGCPLKRSRSPGGARVLAGFPARWLPRSSLADTSDHASSCPPAPTLLRPGWPAGRRRPDRVSTGPPIGLRRTADGSPGGGRGVPGRRKRSRRPFPSRPHATQSHDVWSPRAPLCVPDLRTPHLRERRLRGAWTGRSGAASGGRATRGPGHDATASSAGAGCRSATRNARPRSPGRGTRTRARGRRPQPSPRAAHAPSASGWQRGWMDPKGASGRDQPGPGSTLPLFRGREPLGLRLPGRRAPSTAE